MFLIREFKPTDLAIVSRFVTDSIGETYHTSFYLDLQTAWPEGSLVADWLGEPVGYLGGANINSKRARILVLAVDAPYRGKGIGSALLASFFKRCIQEGLTTVVLEVRVSNLRAIKFYRKHGFEFATLLPAYYSNGEDGYQLVKYL